MVKDASTNPINFPTHHFAGKGVIVTNAPSIDNLTCYNDIRIVFRNKKKLRRLDAFIYAPNLTLTPKSDSTSRCAAPAREEQLRN